MNKKGEVFFVATLLSLAVGGAALLAVPFSTNSFRTRKAMEKCTSSGLDDCESLVSGMSKADKLAYIKDSEVPAMIDNEGNVR